MTSSTLFYSGFLSCRVRRNLTFRRLLCTKQSNQTHGNLPSSLPIIPPTNTMDDFPRSKVAVRELSHASSTHVQDAHANPSSPTLSKISSESSRHSCEAPRSPSSTRARESEGLTSFPPPGDFKRTTAFDADAPSLYREEDFRGKSNDEVRRMRKRDYAVEISRLMGKQLVRGMNGKGKDM